MSSATPTTYVPINTIGMRSKPQQQPDTSVVAKPKQTIHLLYVPTVFCNLDCSYCYLGEQTSIAHLREDIHRAVSTLKYALNKFENAGILPFNVSLHGGEVTTMPPKVLAALFTEIRSHYLRHFDALNSLGYRKIEPHIKTNLYKFAPLYALFEQHKVSISASIDLPLRLHDAYRLQRSGRGWLKRTKENLKLLATYPHKKKISATLSAVHLDYIDEIIEDIWFIHNEIGFDMNQMNLMFAFESELNTIDPNKIVLKAATKDKQMALYHALTEHFMGTELEDGLRRHWFDEFKPSYCTNAFNCGEKFYLLQSDGSIYSCVRGQGIPEFCYGNIFDDEPETILANGAHQISLIHQEYGFDDDCRSCHHLSKCHSGCPVVKYQRHNGKSYTCELQHQIYADNPLSYPPDSAEKQAFHAYDYQQRMHPMSNNPVPKPKALANIRLPNDLAEEKNALIELINADPILQTLYNPKAIFLEWEEETIALESQILKEQRTILSHVAGNAMRLHIHQDVLTANASDPLRNTLYLQMLRDSDVVYGDEQRTKQAHLFTYQLWLDFLEQSRLGSDYRSVDISAVIDIHQNLYQDGVLNNLFITTHFLREYHYQKQKNNAFYHIQAINLPFQNVEFYYLKGE